MFQDSLSHNFPEQSGLVIPIAEEDEDRSNYPDDHPASQVSIQQLHQEMDALLADSSASHLSAEQEMLLRQSEISNRAQMEAFRVPVTASIDRVMQRQAPDWHEWQAQQQQAAMHHPHPNGPIQPPQPQQKKQHDDDGFLGGFRCFRACS